MGVPLDAEAPPLRIRVDRAGGRVLSPRQPPLGNSGHEVQPVQFRHRQRHRLRHRATVAARRTFLLGRNRTFAFGAYTLASEIGRYVNFPRLSLYGPQNQKATSIPTSG